MEDNRLSLILGLELLYLCRYDRVHYGVGHEEHIRDIWQASLLVARFDGMENS